MVRGRDGSRHAWNTVHATAEMQEERRATLSHESTKLDRQGSSTAPARVSQAAAIVLDHACIGCQLANKNLQKVHWVYQSSLVTQALCALLEVAEAEKARANSRNAEAMPPAHDLRPSVVEIIEEEGVPAQLHLGSRDDRSRP